MYIKYKSLSKNENVSAFIPKEIESSINDFFNELSSKINNKYGDIDNYCLKKLNIKNNNELFSYFSAEQIDAVGNIIYQIENKQAVILADETGIGKGRTLASIYKYCKNNNKKLLFFTYTKDLFSDFVRDLNDIGEFDFLEKIWVVHNNTTVYNKEGEIVFKASKTKNTKKINEKNIDNIDLMFCTYSQINSSKYKNKIDFLLKYCEKDTIIVLDESHNACGKSYTRKNIEKLIDKSQACIYASATFLKNEDEFDLYKRALVNIDDENLSFFKKSLNYNDSTELRTYITKLLISKGTLIRREHEPMQTAWEHQIVDFSNYENRFNDIRDIFSIVFDIIEETKSNQLVYDDLKSGWFNAGSHINRIFKNILLLSKIDFLCKNVVKDVQNNKKPVIVLESTFSAIINALINQNQEINLIDDASNDDNNGESDEIFELNFDDSNKDLSEILNLKSYLNLIIDKILFKSLPKFGLSDLIYQKIENLKSNILNINDSWCFLSPIDLIINNLKNNNISCVEISGREFYLEKENGKQFLKKKENISKTKLINQFNNENKQVAIITRSGSTGFSLHSSSSFKNQQQRVLYELEISNRPTVRAQFIGRVRRKGQVVEPLFRTVISNLPFEARLVENEQEKMRRMSAHISTDTNRLIGENIINLYSEEADFLAKQILILNPNLAEKMGINLNVKYEQFYFIDMLLKRSIVLNTKLTDKIYNYILSGLNTFNEQNKFHKNYNYKIEKTFSFINSLSDQEKKTFKEKWLVDKNHGLNNVNYNFSCLSKITNEVVCPNIDEIYLKEEYNKSNNISEQEKNFLKKTILFLSNSIYLNNFKDYYKIFYNQINNFNKGAYISFTNENGNILGYIESIEAPKEDYLKDYPTHYIVKIRSLNFDNLPKNSCFEVFYKINLLELILSLNLVIRNNKELNFSKFTQKEKKFVISQYAILGNPLFISYINSLYKIGKIQTLFVDNKSLFSVLISKEIDDETLFSLRKPVLDIKHIYKLLIDKNTIFTSPSSKYEGAIKLEPSTGSVILYSKNYNDKEIFDFALYQVIGNGSYANKEKKYTIGYKDLIKVCLMLNKRGVNFFV